MRGGIETKPSTIFLVDDHPIVRQGLALIINREPGLMVCGEADDAHSALRAILTLKPDLVIADISLNGIGGLEILRSLRETDVKSRVLMLSMHDEKVYAERALRAGANGYIMKQEASEKILEAVRRILAGDVYVSDRVANQMLRQLASGPSAIRQSPVDALTDREMEVFRLIGEGHGTRQIANELHLSAKTVETYQLHIKQKLGLNNARELVQRAIECAIRENQAVENLLSVAGSPQ